MADDKDDQDRDATAASQPLYDWWLRAVPGFFGAAAPPPGQDAPAPAAASRPFPLDMASQALSASQSLLASLYEAYLRLLVVGQPGEQLRFFESLVEDRIAGLADKLVGIGQAFSGHPNLAELQARLTGAPLTALGEALKPLSLNLDRAYGGLFDAIGLAPLRSLEAAGRDLALAAVAQRQAQVEYLEVVAGALGKGAETLVVRLAEAGQRGESIDSLLALVRLWARTTDEAMHTSMQTPRALEASAKLLRTAARARQLQQRLVAIASEALDVPTRADVDEAYREIQELKRELRRLRKAAPELPAAGPAPEAQDAATPPPPAGESRAKARARAPRTRSKNSPTA